MLCGAGRTSVKSPCGGNNSSMLSLLQGCSLGFWLLPDPCLLLVNFHFVLWQGQLWLWVISANVSLAPPHSSLCPHHKGLAEVCPRVCWAGPKEVSSLYSLADEVLPLADSKAWRRLTGKQGPWLQAGSVALGHPCLSFLTVVPNPPPALSDEISTSLPSRFQSNFPLRGPETLLLQGHSNFHRV